jgi:hypothetical protein
MELPVIITYFGGSPNYLIYALKSAARTNNEVVLIGDKTNKNLWKNHWNTTYVKSEKWQNFMKCYVQMSDYTQKYEIGFWKRIFFLEKWMNKKNVKKVFMIESDVVSFANYSRKVYPFFPNDCISALMIPKKQGISVWAASTHFSYWTISALEDFTNFCIDAYSNENIKAKLVAKYQWHKKNKMPGGVTEMTLLYLWSEKNPKVYNLCRVINDMTIDLAGTSSDNYFQDEYQMKLGLKRFIFKNGIPYGYNRILKKEIRFGCIHCQGWAKSIMRFLYNRITRRFYSLFILIEQKKIKLKNTL